MTTPKALIIGITGGFGNAAAEALARHDWSLRAMRRDTSSPCQTYGADVVRGDAQNPDDVIRAAQGVDVIVHGANPHGYRNWRSVGIPMLENIIAAAKTVGARIVFPGNTYNFDPKSFPILREEARQEPRTRKGAIRVEMERLLKDSKVPTLIVRASDFFGPISPQSWLHTVMLTKLKRGVVVYPGDPDVGHAWAYLPDLGETVAQLLERRTDLEDFAVFHFAGHYIERGVDFAYKTGQVAGIERPRIKNLPWKAIWALSPLVPLFREVWEMRYLWREELRLDNAKLMDFLGYEPHTPLMDALRHTLGQPITTPIGAAQTQCL